MKYIDVHSHLDMCEDIPGIIESCMNVGVEIITHGVNLKTNRLALELARDHKIVKAALGFYPIDAFDYGEDEIDHEIEFIRENKKKIVAIGEVGVDLKNGTDIDSQSKTFRKFINLSKEIGKPIVVHSWKAEKEAIEILESEKVEKVIMHCFSGGMKLVDRIIANGWCITIPASVKYSEHFQKVVERTPIENLLCETDSPFLHPDKEKNNTSDNVVVSYQKIAEIKKMKLEDVRDKIYSNCKKLALID